MTSDIETCSRQQASGHGCTIAAVVLIMAYPLMFIWQGLDFTDTGGFLTNYQQIFNAPSSVQRGALYWMSHIIGGVWMLLVAPLGFVGMSLGAALTVHYNALLVYALLRRHVSRNRLLLILLVTVVLTTRARAMMINYNTLTASFVLTTAVLLFSGIVKGRKALIVAAGAALGIGVFVRIPNVLVTGLLLAIPFYEAVMLKRRFPWTACLAFAGGFVAGLGCSLGLFYSLGHFSMLRESVFLEILLPSEVMETEAVHSSGGLIRRFIRDHAIIVALLSVAVVTLSAITKLTSKLSSTTRHALFGVIAVCIAGALLFFPVVYGYSLLNYTLAGFIYAVLLGYVTGLIPCSDSHRLVSFVALLVFAVTPLGSGNGINNCMYGAWIAIPILLNFFSSVDGFCIMRWRLSRSELVDAGRLVTAIVLLCAVTQAYSRPIRDNPQRHRLTASVEHPYLRGTLTTPERACVVQDFLNTLSGFVSTDDYLLAYEHIPLVHYLTGTRPYLYNAWPMLHSPEAFKYCLDKATAEHPLPVVARATASTLNPYWPDRTGEARLTPGPPRHLMNRELMAQFISTNHYNLVWSNSFFEILIPPRMHREDSHTR